MNAGESCIDGVKLQAHLNNGVVAGGGSAELHVIEKVKNLRLKGLEQVGLEVVATLESIMDRYLLTQVLMDLKK